MSKPLEKTINKIVTMITTAIFTTSQRCLLQVLEAELLESTFFHAGREQRSWWLSLMTVCGGRA